MILASLEWSDPIYRLAKIKSISLNLCDSATMLSSEYSSWDQQESHLHSEEQMRPCKRCCYQI